MILKLPFHLSFMESCPWTMKYFKSKFVFDCKFYVTYIFRKVLMIVPYFKSGKPANQQSHKKQTKRQIKYKNQKLKSTNQNRKLYNWQPTNKQMYKLRVEKTDKKKFRNERITVWWIPKFGTRQVWPWESRPCYSRDTRHLTKEYKVLNKHNLEKNRSRKKCT